MSAPVQERKMIHLTIVPAFSGTSPEGKKIEAPLLAHVCARPIRFPLI